MNIIVTADYDELSRLAAEAIATLVREKPDCVLGLATGATPIGTYRALARLHKAGLDFARVRTFNLDEYVGLGMDRSQPCAADQSYARFMHEEFFRHVNIRPENTHLPDGRASDPEAACARYEDAIRRAGGIDVQLLGIGGNGHWAFNEPGSLFTSRTRVIPLTEDTRADNYRSFFAPAGLPWESVPCAAITMGVGTILEARSLLMLASGEKKAPVVAQALEAPPTPLVTASAIQLFNGEATVILDRSAARELRGIA